MVLFVSQHEAAGQFRKRGFDEVGLISGSRAEKRLKCRAFVYQSRVRNGPQIADAIVRSLGDFTTCLLWACHRRLGDHTRDDAVNADWRDYADWRTAHGAARTLSEEPGHLFSAGEGGALARLIAAALYLGWDGLIKSDAVRTIVRLSHEDRIEIYGASMPAGLVAELSGLCEPAPWFTPRSRA